MWKGIFFILLSSCTYNNEYEQVSYIMKNCCRRHNELPIERYYKDNEFSPEWNFKVFVAKTVIEFKYELLDTDCELLEFILYYIWEYIGYNDRNKLALFVATSLHNTSFYKIFESCYENKKFKSRGLLMIKGYNNYVHLTSLSINNNNYIKYPDLLALPRYDTIADTIIFWKEKLKGCYTFENMMKSLRIQSFYENKNNPDIKNWRNIYNKLKNAYCIN